MLGALLGCGRRKITDTKYDVKNILRDKLKVSWWVVADYNCLIPQEDSMDDR